MRAAQGSAVPGGEAAGAGGSDGGGKEKEEEASEVGMDWNGGGSIVDDITEVGCSAVRCGEVWCGAVGRGGTRSSAVSWGAVR